MLTDFKESESFSSNQELFYICFLKNQMLQI